MIFRVDAKLSQMTRTPTGLLSMMAYSFKSESISSRNPNPLLELLMPLLLRRRHRLLFLSPPPDDDPAEAGGHEILVFDEQ